MMTQPRGFALLIALIVTTVLVSVGLALVDLAYKQSVLSSTAKGSQIAFYNSDAALECVLFHDQKFNAFSQTNATTSIRCNNQVVPVSGFNSGALRTSSTSVPCTGGVCSQVTIIKNTNGETTIFANGYSSGDVTDQRRVERGLKVTYEGFTGVLETCMDGIRNQDETGIDTGGVCGATATGSFTISPAVSGNPQE